MAWLSLAIEPFDNHSFIKPNTVIENKVPLSLGSVSIFYYSFIGDGVEKRAYG